MLVTPGKAILAMIRDASPEIRSQEAQASDVCDHNRIRQEAASDANIQLRVSLSGIMRDPDACP